MKIMKFGGAVLKNRDGFQQMSDILQSLDMPIVVVVSAFAETTRKLEDAANNAQAGDKETAAAAGKLIVEENRSIARALFRDGVIDNELDIAIANVERRLLNTLHGVAITRQLTGRTLDLIRSFGEYLSLDIVRHYLEKSGLRVYKADAADLIATDDNYGMAAPLAALTAQQIAAARSNGNFREKTIIQGYVARGLHGEITTMGKESSNLTATLLGEALQADEVVIWTDVEGIFSADPKIVADALPIFAMSYHDAELAARYGAKPLYLTMIEPMRRANIPLVFRSAFSPQGNATIIDGREQIRPQMIITEPSSSLGSQTILSLLNISPLTAFNALRKIPSELIGDSFGLEIGTLPDAQRITIPVKNKLEAASYFHKEIFGK